MKKTASILSLLSLAVFSQESRPNFILLMADDMGWGDTHYNGHPKVITPNLDAMAAVGVNFRRFHAQSAVCSPTRGSVLTGRHPERFGVTTANAGRLEPEELTIAEVLKTQGYRTGHFGKWHLGTLNFTAKFPDGNRGGNQKNAKALYSPPWENGFDSAFSTESKVPTWNPMVDQPEQTHYWNAKGEVVTDNLEGDDSRVIMDRVIPFIQGAAKDKQPFLAVVWFHTCHEPFRAGPAYLSKYPGTGDSAKYWGALTAMDEQIGRLRKELDDLGLDNTFLAFTSDNGPERHTPGLTNGLKGRKHDYYEGGIRVPGLVVWPAVIKSGFASDYIAVSSDYYPTILDILKLQVVSGQPMPVDGVSFLDVLTGKQTVRTQPLAFFVKANRDTFSAVILEDKKLIKKGKGNWQFFDLAVDSGETTDAIADPKYKATVDRLLKLAPTMIGQLVFTEDKDYPTEPLAVGPDGTTALRQTRFQHLLGPATFDGVYNIQGRALDRMQRESGGVLSKQGSRTYLIRKKKDQ